MRKLSFPFWFLPFLAFFLLLSETFGQQNNEIDSLQNIIDSTQNDSIKADMYKEIGSIYFYKLAYKDAFFYYLKADSICQQNEALQISDLRASLYNYLGYSVRVTHGMNKAVEYYRKAKEMYQETGNEFGVQEVNVAMSQMYTREKQYDKALQLLNESIEYHQKNNLTNQYSYSFAIICRGYLFIQMRRFDLAEKDYQTYYKIAFAGDNESVQLFALQYMGYFFKEKKDLSEANFYYNRCINMAEELGDYETIKVCYEDLIDMYKTSKNVDSLVSSYQQYIDNRDILDSINKDQEIFELETKYQTEKKEQEITLLSAQNKLTEQSRKNQQYLYLGILGFFLAIVALLFFGYRNKLRTAEKIKELDALKSRFFANISHEFRTPLTLIKSPLQRLKTTSDETAQKQLTLIDNSADRMLELVDQLLELSKIESGHLKIFLKKGNLSSFINTLVELFTFQAKEKDIPFQVDIHRSEDLHYFDRDISTKIIVNLLSNAFKYRESGMVTFSSRIVKEKLELKISNFNKQVKERDLRKFFERFYQNDNASVGFGIGLALVKDLVAVNEGTINAHLDNGKVIISVEIPLRTDLKNAVLVEETSDRGLVTKEKDIDTEIDEIPVLLIADDNPDIRNVLRGIFKNDFKILDAQDGKEAYEIAQNEIPDCIISDVMMPLLDGFALVQRLKEDELTASVPVVLLTAKASDESHLQGLQNHADAYLTKPFNHQILKATVEQILQERKKLQERYSRELILRPVDIAVSTADEKFIQRLETVLSTELTNPDFTTGDFADQMNMSRMQLHRKLKSLLGVSATEFVRSERLKAAAELLKNPELSVADVAYSAGFNEVTYFSRCFKNVYNLSPSDFRKSV